MRRFIDEPETLHLGLESIRFARPHWWNSGEPQDWLTVLTTELEHAHPWTWEIRSTGESGRLDDGSLWSALATRGTSTRVHLHAGPAVSLAFSLREGFSDASVTVHEDWMARHADALIQPLLDAAVMVATASSVVGLRPWARVGVPRLRYPRPFPPPMGPWPMNAVGLLVHTDPAPGQDARYREDVERLSTYALPAGVVREQRGAWLSLRWANTLSDLTHAASDAHAWMGATVSRGMLEGGYTHLGDRLYTDLLPTHPSRGPFECYHEAKEIGYFALSAVDIARLDALEQWISAGVTPDGTPIRAIRVIANHRHEALALREPAHERGIRAVFYRSALHPESHLRLPFPPGPWRTHPLEPTPAPPPRDVPEVTPALQRALEALRASLIGTRSIEIMREERTILDALVRQYDLASEPDKAPIARTFAALLQDDDITVRSGAVSFFVRRQDTDEQDALFAAWQQMHLYDGVPQAWVPGQRDLRSDLAQALGAQLPRARTPAILEALRAEAFVPGRGAIVTRLLKSDPDWTDINYPDIIERTPGALAGLLMWLRFANVDVIPALTRVAGRIPAEALRQGIVDAQLPDAEALIAAFCPGCG
ncbi:MAG: hypothetical protein ACON4N_04520 [Myxococcota bacterium]